MAGLDEDHPPAFPCLPGNALIIRRIMHDQTVITIHIFQVLVQFIGGFPRFKVTFNCDTLLYVENFETRNKERVYFDGDKMKSAEATETSTL